MTTELEAKLFRIRTIQDNTKYMSLSAQLLREIANRIEAGTMDKTDPIILIAQELSAHGQDITRFHQTQ